MVLKKKKVYVLCSERKSGNCRSQRDQLSVVIFRHNTKSPVGTKYRIKYSVPMGLNCHFYDYELPIFCPQRDKNSAGLISPGANIQ
jgi:hypothetical protein